MNNVSLIGRIAMDSKQGNNVVSSLLAVKRIYHSKDGVDTDFIQLTVFGHQAANFSKMVQKGDKIGVDGSIKTSKYTDQNGEIKYGFAVAVNHFYLLASKQKSSQQVANLTAEQIEALSSQLSAASKQAEVTVSNNELPF